MIVSIASGKGGTGKTTVAVNLGLSSGRALTVVDCDVEGPNTHHFFPLVRYQSSRVFSLKVPAVDMERCTSCGVCSQFCAYNALAVMNGSVLIFPELCHGCLGCAMLCPEKAISFRERPAGRIERGEVIARSGEPGLRFVRGESHVTEQRSKLLIRAVRESVDGDSDSIIDCPPGTVLAAEAIRGSDMVLIVAEPTLFGISDLSRICELAQAMALPASVLINKSGPFDWLVEQFCVSSNINIIGRLPYSREIAKSISKGLAISLENEEYRSIFHSLFQRIVSFCR
jgi:MinD superfamily P-loop ATPase